MWVSLQLFAVAFVGTLLVTRSTLAERFVLSKVHNKTIAEGMSCPMCAGFWITGLTWLVMGGTILDAMFGYILVVFAMALYDSITFRPEGP